MILPAKPPFYPKQFHKCAVVGNSGDLLKTEFGREIDSHDAVIRDNEAPVIEVVFLKMYPMITKLVSFRNLFMLCLYVTLWVP